MIAAGPFSLNEDSSMDENFVEFAKQIKIENANLVILVRKFFFKNFFKVTRIPHILVFSKGYF